MSLLTASFAETTATADFSQVLGNIGGQAAQKNGGAVVASAVRQTVQTIFKPTSGALELHGFGGFSQGKQGDLSDGNNIVIFSAECCHVCRQALSYLKSYQGNYASKSVHITNWIDRSLEGKL